MMHKLYERRLGILTKVITITDTDRIFFDGCSRPRSRDRYLVAPDNSSHYGDSILTPQCDENNVALEEPCVTPTRQRATPYQNILNVLQQWADRPRTVRRLGCQPQSSFEQEIYERVSEQRYGK